MKKKLNNFIKNNRWVLFAAALSSIVVVLIYILQRIAPFGNNSMLDVDFYHQYGPLLNELYDRIKSGETLLYSFNTGGGMPFYRNFLNYLSSPFNLMLFLFKKENIVMAFSIIIGLKAIASSTAMSYYLKKTFKNNNIMISLFGTLYAFSGYFCAYYWNIMWLDGMVFLPIIMLGINKIIEEEKINTYVISLAIMLFANYFIGYMICLFSVLYFIGIFIYKHNFKLKNILKKGLLFGISSLISAGLVAFMLLPLFYSLSSISATGDVMPTVSSSFSISNYVFNHFTGVSRTVFASDILPLPNIYPGMFVLPLIILLFINKKINIRFKIISAFAIFFFFFTFNINTIDFIWHAFHVPNDLPWRYSFIYTFVLITIGYCSLLKIKDVSLFKIAISFAIVFILILIASKVGFENITNQKVIICLGLLILYFIFALILNNNKYNNVVIYLILSATILFECVYAINTNWQINHDIKSFMKDKEPYKNMIKDLRENDNDLYRMEKTDYLTLNDGAWYDYNGISTFTSMAYENTAKMQRKLGLAGNNINSYYYRYYQTPVYNTMFNVKYIMGDYIENKYYDLLKTNDNNNLVNYKYNSSFAYAVNNEINNWNLVNYNPFLNQENFVTLSTLENNVFIPIKVTEESNSGIVKTNNDNLIGELNYKLNDEKNELILTLDNSNHDNIYLYVGGFNVESFQVDHKYYSITSDEYYILDIGSFKSDKVDVKINFNGEKEGIIYFYAYRLNDASFKKFYNNINKNKLDVQEYNDTYIKGNINVDENKTLFTTISYDDGWNIYVDGKKVKTKKIADTYLGCKINKGYHEIEFVYYPKKMREGLIITLISFVLMVIYNLFISNKKIKKIKKDEFIV